MKVEKIYKLYELLERFDDNSMDWANIVQLTEEESDAVIQAMDEKNRNAYALFKFYLVFSNYEDSFKESQLGLELEDIKDMIAQKILSSSTVGMAENILDFFAAIPQAFLSEQEFSTYLESMPKTRTLEGRYCREMELLLSSYEEGRIELIEALAHYYDECSCPISLLEYKGLSHVSSASMKTFLELVLRYDAEITANLVLKWNDFQKDNPNMPQHEIAAAKKFLLGVEVQCSPLPNIFLNDDILQYDEIIDSIEEMLNYRCFDMVSNYADMKLENSRDRFFLRSAIHRVLEKRNQDLIDAFCKLIGNGCLTRLIDRALTLDGMNFILEKLAREGTTEVLADLLTRLPFTVWREISPDAEKEVLEIISANLGIYKIRNIFGDRWPWEEEKLNNLIRLSELSKETNEKFVELLNYSSFLEDPRRSELLPVLLSKENEASFDCIFQQYQNYERKKEQLNEVAENQGNLEKFQVQLTTVIDLLNQGYHPDVVLDGFEKEDDITGKTLIRSLKYEMENDAS